MNDKTEELLEAIETQMDALEGLHQALLAWQEGLRKQMEGLDV